MSERIQTQLDALAAAITDTLTDTEAKRLEAETRAADVAVEANRIRDDRDKLQASLAASVARVKELEAGGGGLAKWTPGTVLQANTPYALPMIGLTPPIMVDVPGVSFYGGWLAPTAAGSVITFRAGGVNGGVYGARFDLPNAPATKQRLGVKPAIGCGVGTRVIRCIADNVDTFVEMLNPDSSLVMDGNTGTANVRAGFLYCGGGRRVILTNNDAADSQNENLVRFSPQTNVVPDEIVIAFNKLANPGNKAALEIRSGSNVVVYRNEFWASHFHTCIGVGRKGSAGGPGATRVRVIDNVCHEGQVNVDAGAADVVIEGTTMYGLLINQADPDQDDHGITADGRAGTLNGLRLRNNRGIVNAQPRRPFFGPLAPEKISGLEADATNVWVIQP